MNILNILIIIAIIFITVELLKHFFLRKFSKAVIVIAIIVISLLVFSKYAVENEIVDPKNKLFITGAIITNNLKNLGNDIDIDENMDEINKIKDDINKKTLTKIKTITN